jgi:deoxyribodipyrimidine photolyase-related protein
MKPPCRHLLLVLGDQLDMDSSLFDGLDPACDAVLMIEAFEESTHVWSHKARTALFLAAMRHFAEKLRQRGVTVHYRALEHEGDLSLAAGLRAALLALQPERVIGVEPGDLRVRALIEKTCKPEPGQRTPLDWREDNIFYAACRRFANGPASRPVCAWSFSTARCASNTRC